MARRFVLRCDARCRDRAAPLSHGKKPSMRLRLVCLCFLSLAGCAQHVVVTGPGGTIPGERPGAPQVVDDSFESHARIQGGPLRHASGNYLLRSFVDKRTGAVQHQLYATTSYRGDWRFFERAAGEDMRELEFSAISRDVGSCPQYLGCSFTEAIGATLPDTVLRERWTTGYAVKFSARSGHTMVLPITREQIVEQMNAVEGYQASRSLPQEGATGSR